MLEHRGAILLPAAAVSPPPGCIAISNDENADASPPPRPPRRAVLAPRVESDREAELARLRAQALAAFGVSASGKRRRVAVEGGSAVSENVASIETAGVPRCSCLRRGGVCTCAEDASWLRAKRPLAAPKYAAPHQRRRVIRAVGEMGADGIPAACDDTAVVEQPSCKCLRRSARCTCTLDSKWLRRKRESVVPYVAPYARARLEEADQRRADVVEASASASVAGGVEKPFAGRAEETMKPMPNIRAIARKWEPTLERRGAHRFNPLQAEGHIEIPDEAGLIAECTESSFAWQGVKALPVVQGGSYQFEVELLRDSAIVIGWSSALSMASHFDSQAYGFSSKGEKIHKHEGAAYGTMYGRTGDVIGSFVKWSSSGDCGAAAAVVRISFALNGKDMGTAFELRATSPSDALPVPLQPHIGQLPQGALMHVRLRGAAGGLQLAYPVAGYTSISTVSDADFSPFSRSVALASAERAAASVTLEQLRDFCVPDANVVEIYNDADACVGEAVAAKLVARVVRLLALPAADARRLFHVQATAVDGSTALAAFRRPAHAARLVAIATSGESADGLQSPQGVETVDLLARPLQHATLASREFLQQRRGEAFRPQADPSVARRLIHGCLQSQIPLFHLFDEKNRRIRSAGPS